MLYVIGLDTDKLPTPRSDGDREALRILLCAREEMTTTSTGQRNRLKALLRHGEDTDRHLARGKLTVAKLSELAKRPQPRDANRAQAIRHAEIRRLAVAVGDAAQALATNRKQLDWPASAKTWFRPRLGGSCAPLMFLSASLPTGVARSRPEPVSMLAVGHPEGLALSPARTVRSSANAGSEVCAGAAHAPAGGSCRLPGRRAISLGRRPGCSQHP